MSAIAVKEMVKPERIEHDKEYSNLFVDYVGNTVCQDCAGCCMLHRGQWKEYYEGQRDVRQLGGLVRKHKWLADMLKVAREREKREEWVGVCDMLEVVDGHFSCMIHRRIGFEAKPRTCRKFRCRRMVDAIEGKKRLKPGDYPGGMKRYKERVRKGEEARGER